MREGEGALVVLGDSTDLYVVFIIAVVALLCDAPLFLTSFYQENDKRTSRNKVGKWGHRSVRMVHLLRDLKSSAPESRPRGKALTYIACLNLE